MIREFVEFRNHFLKGVNHFNCGSETQNENTKNKLIDKCQLHLTEDKLQTSNVLRLDFGKQISKSRVAMLDNQLTLVPEIPVDNPGGNKKKKVKQYNNCLSFILNELMFERKISIAMIVKETGIPWATISDWANYKTNSQMLDENIMKLAKYFNVSLKYLCFGIGEPDSDE